MTTAPEDNENIWPGGMPRPAQNYQEQSSTARVDGMASAETLFKNRQPNQIGYQPGQYVGGHYEIIELVGKGGMSLVYKARHALIDQFRAIKVLVAQSDPQGRALRRFQEEARLSMQLEHPNIVRVLEFASPADGGPPYMVMDFVEGRSLEQEISLFKKLTAERASLFVRQIIDALQYVHEKGIIHRDLKPANLIIVKELDARGGEKVSSKIKLIDFGIAKKLIDDDEDSRLVTPSGEIVGSPQHMSPEQCAGEDMDERSEIYSLGCILYEMLSGKPPILGKNALDTLRMQASVEPRPLEHLVESAEAKAMAPVVHRCLNKDPDERYQTLADLKAALAQKDKRSDKPRMPLAAVVAAVALSFGAGYLASQMLAKSNTLVPAAKESTTDNTTAKNESSPITPELQSFVTSVLSPSTVVEAIRFKPAMKDNRRREEAESLHQDLNLAADFDSKLFSRVERMAYDDRDYVEVSLQKDIFERAYRLSGEKDSKLTKAQSDLLKTLYNLTVCQSAIWKEDLNAHGYFWDLLKSTGKLKDSDHDKGWQAFFCGDFYQSLGDSGDAKTCYDQAQAAFNEQYGPLDLRTAIANARRYKETYDAGELKERLTRCTRTLDALDEAINRNDHFELAGTARARLLARLAQFRPEEFTQRAGKSIDQSLAGLQKLGDNYSKAYADQLVAKEKVLALSGKHERQGMLQALGIYLAHGSTGEAAMTARDASRLFLSPDKINVRLRLLNTARDLSVKLSKAGLDQQTNIRDCCIELATIQSDEQSGQFCDAAASLKILDQALTIQNDRLKQNKDDEFYQKREHWPLAQIAYLKARAYLVELDPRLAKSNLKIAEDALKTNLEFVETYADKVHHRDAYLQDKKERLELKSKIEQALIKVKE